MISKIKKFLNLNAPERRLFVLAVSLLLAIRLALLVFPFRWIRAAAMRLSKAPVNARSGDENTMRRIVLAIERASRIMPGTSLCLTKALAGQILLGRSRCPVSLRIGVTRGNNGALEAHAWLVCEGEVIMGGLRNLSDFKQFPRLEGENL